VLQPAATNMKLVVAVKARLVEMFVHRVPGARSCGPGSGSPMLATMANNNAWVVACCRTAHRVIVLPVSEAFPSTRRTIFLK
jgi:hypothetical protein